MDRRSHRSHPSPSGQPPTWRRRWRTFSRGWRAPGCGRSRGRGALPPLPPPRGKGREDSLSNFFFSFPRVQWSARMMPLVAGRLDGPHQWWRQFFFGLRVANEFVASSSTQLFEERAGCCAQRRLGGTCFQSMVASSGPRDSLKRGDAEERGDAEVGYNCTSVGSNLVTAQGLCFLQLFRFASSYANAAQCFH